MPLRRQSPLSPEARNAQCGQDCWGLANKADYDACMNACFCTSYPNTCQALQRLAASGTGSGTAPSPGVFMRVRSRPRGRRMDAMNQQRRMEAQGFAVGGIAQAPQAGAYEAGMARGRRLGAMIKNSR